MSIKIIFWGFVLVLLTAMGWRYRDAEVFQQWIHPQHTTPAVITFDNDPPPSIGPAPQTDATPVTASKVVGGMRKCRKGSELIYTDGNCPPGSKEQSIGGGSVTVIPGQSPSAQINSTAQAASRSTVRDLLVEPNSVNLQEKRMDQIINR